MSSKNDVVRVRVAAKTIFTERSADFTGGPGYTGAPSMHQLPGSAANRRRLVPKRAPRRVAA